MGAYINPQGETKEQFLNREGEKLNSIPIWDLVPDKMLPVCLVLNPMFSAAAIIYSKRELEAFTDPSDYRPRTFFIVPIEKLKMVSPELQHYLK